MRVHSVLTVLLAVTAAARSAGASVTYLNQNRYVRAMSETRMNSGGALVSSSDHTTPASGFGLFDAAEFSPALPYSTQHSLMNANGITADGTITVPGASIGPTMYTIRGALTHFNLQFSLDVPTAFTLTTLPHSSQWVNISPTIIGPGGQTLALPPAGQTLSGTLAAGTWTWTSTAGSGVSSMPREYRFANTMTFVPEPSSLAGGVILVTLLRRRRAEP